MAENTNTEREAIIRAAVAAMPHTNPLVADDLIEGHTMHTEADDIVAIWNAARASMSLPAAGQEPGAWPKDAAEVREFFKSDFISAQFAAPDHSPCDEDRYYISAHDFLSAINWWADFPNYAAPQPAVAAGWMPIETAPKDGRCLLLFYKNLNGLGRTVVATWVTDEEAAETDTDCVGLEAGWYERVDNWDDYSQVAIHEGEPTHWMPLPPAPSTEGESNG